MSARSEGDVDRLILSFALVRWRKVAMIIAKVVDASGRGGGDAELHDVAERVRALVEDGRLEPQGNLSKWRHSEVRLTHLD
jgi:hypothetical protein